MAFMEFIGYALIQEYKELLPYKDDNSIKRKATIKAELNKAGYTITGRRA